MKIKRISIEIETDRGEVRVEFIRPEKIQELLRGEDFFSEIIFDIAETI